MSSSKKKISKGTAGSSRRRWSDTQQGGTEAKRGKRDEVAGGESRARTSFDSSSLFAQFAVENALEQLVNEVQLMRGELSAVNQLVVEMRHKLFSLSIPPNNTNAKMRNVASKRKGRLKSALLSRKSAKSKAKLGGASPACERTVNSDHSVDRIFEDDPLLEQNLSEMLNKETAASKKSLKPLKGTTRSLKEVKEEAMGESASMACGASVESLLKSTFGKESPSESDENQTSLFTKGSDLGNDEGIDLNRPLATFNAIMSNTCSSCGHLKPPEKDDSRAKIKPLPTALPKPQSFRDNKNGAQLRVSNEWKEYALSMYPIRPNQYWDIPREAYDALIPDKSLATMTAKEKSTTIRSIYDWFRYQHRMAQLRVVLTECSRALDVDELWTEYELRMNERGWPIYGTRFKKSEVHFVQRQILESFFVDCSHSFTDLP